MKFSLFRKSESQADVIARETLKLQRLDAVANFYVRHTSLNFYLKALGEYLRGESRFSEPTYFFENALADISEMYGVWRDRDKNLLQIDQGLRQMQTSLRQGSSLPAVTPLFDSIKATFATVRPI